MLQDWFMACGHSHDLANESDVIFKDGLEPPDTIVINILMMHRLFKKYTYVWWMQGQESVSLFSYFIEAKWYIWESVI